MLLRSLEVRDFRGVRQARLTFGRGLNVLFGPNELGKSTLAESIRSAFLLPVGSRAAEDLVPWGTDCVPRVVVEFETQTTGEPACVWRITKCFDSGKRASALLERQSTSGTFLEDSRGRNVEGRLRELLAWGIPAPGGRAAPRGVPESYLTTALLGQQDHVTSIFEASLDSDAEASGRDRLTQALGALGQDPLITRMLERLESRSREVFTETGQLRRTADSPLVQGTAEINRCEQRIQELEDSVRRSAEIEQKIQSLRERQQAAEEQRRRLDLHLKIRQTLRQQAAIRQATTDLQTAETEVSRCETAHRDAAAKFGALNEQLKNAGEQLARVSERRTQILASAEQTREARRVELTARRDSATQTALAAQEVLDAGQHVEVRQKELSEAAQQLQLARLELDRAEKLVTLARCENDVQIGRTLIATRDAARRELDEHKDHVNAAQTQMTKRQTELADAELAVVKERQARDAACRVAQERELRTETLQAKFLRLQAAERAAQADLALTRAASARAERLTEAERTLAEHTAEKLKVDETLSSNATRKDSCDKGVRRVRAGAAAALFGGIVSLALAAALADARVPLLIVGVGCGVALVPLTVRLLRNQKQLDQLARDRERLQEERNEVSGKCLLSQSQVEAARRECEDSLQQLADAFGDIATAPDQAAAKLGATRDELREVETELARLAAESLASAAAAAPQLIIDMAAITAAVAASSRAFDDARRALIAAEVRATSSEDLAASVNLDELVRRVEPARIASGIDSIRAAPTMEEAQAHTMRAKEHLDAAANQSLLARQRVIDAQTRLAELAARLTQPAAEVLAHSEQIRNEAASALHRLDNTATVEMQTTEAEWQQAQSESTNLAEQHTAAQAAADIAASLLEVARRTANETRFRFATLRESEIAMPVDATEAEIEQVRTDMRNESPAAGDAAFERQLAEAANDLQTATRDLDETRGQLRSVGGAVVRGQLEQEQDRHERLRSSATEMELEYQATRHLLELLTAADAKQATHLGRSLAKPVTTKFLELTGNRYADVVLGPDLKLSNIVALSGERRPTAMSVGTQDQLATLVRLALAGHLRSVLVLDDQLAHSDPDRLRWFRNCLRACVRDHAHQIVVITCRPQDYLDTEEFSQTSSPTDAPDGSLAVVDLTRIVTNL